MSTKNNMLTDISAELDKEFGAPGTPEREKFDEEAYAFYTGQILLDARREAKVTQSELAKRINATKSYISRIESGAINPSVGTFYRIINALGLKIEIVKPIMGIGHETGHSIARPTACGSRVPPQRTVLGETLGSRPGKLHL